MPSLPDGGIVSLDATRMAAAIHNRQISCREVMETYLDRIALVNGRVNAIVSLRDREEHSNRARRGRCRPSARAMA